MTGVMVVLMVIVLMAFVVAIMMAVVMAVMVAVAVREEIEVEERMAEFVLVTACCDSGGMSLAIGVAGAAGQGAAPQAAMSQSCNH